MLICSNELSSLVKKYHENKMAHAFLLETNDMNACMQDVLELVKMINCPHEYEENCSKDCNLCNLVRLQSLPSLMVIEPDGMSIKKSQIFDLQQRFLSKPVYTKNNIYIIKNAEKLNAASANSMLKFLEEPSDYIIGFFMTDNKENVITTIKSRCECMKLIYEAKRYSQALGVEEEQYHLIEETAKMYIKSLETEPDYAILKTKKIVEAFPDRKDMEHFFSYLLHIYTTVVHDKLLHLTTPFLEDYGILRNQPTHILQRKAKVIKNALEMVSFNVNIELLLDHFALEMRDCNES